MKPIRLEKKQIFVWAAIDVDTKECLTMGFRSRGFFEAYVLREILKHENKPEIIVDRGFCTGFTEAWFKIQA